MKSFLKNCFYLTISFAIFFGVCAFAENINFSTKTFIIILLFLLGVSIGIMVGIGLRRLYRKFK